jgi:hypothetical protein
MRSLAVALVLVVATTTTAGPSTIVDADTLLGHIKYLASDQMKGRGDGTPELDRAAEYIAQQFKAAGLQPAEPGGSWYQPFELVAGLTIGRGNRLVVHDGRRDIALTLGTSYYPLSAAVNDDPARPAVDLEHLPVVFAGYGLSVPSLGYDDYAGIDVKGKAVLIFSHEPQEHDPASRLNGTRPMPQTRLEAKASAARRNGARALFVVADPSHDVDDADYRVFAIAPSAAEEGIPVIRIRRDEMRPLVDAWKLEDLARDIDRDLVPQSRPLPGVTLDYVAHLTHNRRVVRNVIGVLPGSDGARSSEAIVIGAHYDHVGLGGWYSMAPQLTGEIHNGADDNASGTAAVMEMARVAVQERSRFPRTLVFVAFAGEELGLLGSANYAEHPVVPLDRTLAMLNFDMVGRSHGAVDVSGVEVSHALEVDLDEAAKATGALTVRHASPGEGRSDDASFLRHQVPAINFFTGFHPDYHRPTDDWQKIDAAGLRDVATLALELAARIAQQ